MARRGRRKSVGDGGFLFLIVALLAPPAGNVIYREFDRRREDDSVTAAALARVQSLENENARLRQRLLREARDARLLDAYDPIYSPRPLRALPVGDLSPTRRAFWVASSDGEPLSGNQAVVSREALVGRLHHAVPRTSVALVQAITDSGFVVRFRLGEAWGILRGTGLFAAGTGLPLLDIELISEAIELRPGLEVFTDGGDGIFPRGLLIGQVAPSEKPGDLGRFQVRAGVSPTGLRDLVALVDRAVQTASSARLSLEDSP